MVICRTDVDEDLDDMEDKIQRLIVGIPNISIDDLPRCYQHQTARGFWPLLEATS